MNIRYTPKALDDLKEIKKYVGITLRNPSAAKKLSKRILDTCHDLKDHPMLGASLEEKIGKPTDLRYLICDKKILFYRIDGNTVSVARIIDGRQDYINILFE